MDECAPRIGLSVAALRRRQGRPFPRRERRASRLAKPEPALCEELLAEQSADLEAALLASRCDWLQTHLLGDEQRHVEAEALARAALARLEPLSEQGSREVRLQLALLHDAAASAVGAQNDRLDEAAALRSRSIDVARALLREQPEDLDLQQFLLHCLSQQAIDARHTGMSAEDLALLSGCVTALRELLDLRADDGTREVLAEALNRLGARLAYEGRPGESCEAFEEELELRRELCDLAANEVLAIVRERGDLEGDSSVAALSAALSDA